MARTPEVNQIIQQSNREITQKYLAHIIVVASKPNADLTKPERWWARGGNYTAC